MMCRTWKCVHSMSVRRMTTWALAAVDQRDARALDGLRRRFDAFASSVNTVL